MDYSVYNNTSIASPWNRFCYNNTASSVPVMSTTISNPVNTSRKKTIIACLVGVLGTTAALFLLAKKGILGNGAKKFVDNLFKSSSTSEVMPKPLHAPSVNKTRAEILAEREKAVEIVNKITGSKSKMTMDKNGKISLCGQFLHDAKEKVYASLRYAKYPEIGDSSIDKITGASTSTIKVTHNAVAGDWNYRIPVKFIKGTKSEERISLNVRPDKSLIRKLDKYLADHVHDINAYYKTPGSFAGWSERHDPITIYLGKKVNKQVLDEIAKIAEPYARDKGNSLLLGRKFGNCCSIIRTPNVKDYELLKKRFLQIFGEENVNLKINPFGVRIGTNPRLSAGEFCAYNEVFNRITGENVQVLMPKL